jgi:hypothetical protein
MLAVRNDIQTGHWKVNTKDRFHVSIGEETIVSRGVVKVLFKEAVVVDTLNLPKFLS